MSLECTTLRFSLIKVRHAEHLQWLSMGKVPMAWENLYGAVYMGMGNMIYSRDGRILTATLCPTRGPWFGIFMRVYRIRMEGINKQDFGITCKVVKDLLEIWE